MTIKQRAKVFLGLDNDRTVYENACLAITVVGGIGGLTYLWSQGKISMIQAFLTMPIIAFVMGAFTGLLFGGDSA